MSKFNIVDLQLRPQIIPPCYLWTWVANHHVFGVTQLLKVPRGMTVDTVMKLLIRSKGPPL